MIQTIIVILIGITALIYVLKKISAQFNKIENNPKCKGCPITDIKDIKTRLNSAEEDIQELKGLRLDEPKTNGYRATKVIKNKKADRGHTSCIIRVFYYLNTDLYHKYYRYRLEELA